LRLKTLKYTHTHTHTHTHTRTVGLLWTIDRPVAGTCTWQHTKFTRNWPPSLRRDSSPQDQEV